MANGGTLRCRSVQTERRLGTRTHVEASDEARRGGARRFLVQREISVDPNSAITPLAANAGEAVDIASHLSSSLLMQNIRRSPESALRERTRLLLDFDKPCIRHHPYRIRRLSSGSTCSSDSSEPSPCSVSSLPDSPNPAIRSTKDIEIFERLRRFVPVISSEKDAFKILVDYVSQVMEIEQQLDELPEEKANPKQRLNSARNSNRYDYVPTLQLSDAYNNEVFPDDLASVDVSAFKHLICSQPVRIDTSLFQ